MAEILRSSGIEESKIFLAVKMGSLNTVTILVCDFLRQIQILHEKYKKILFARNYLNGIARICLSANIC